MELNSLIFPSPESSYDEKMYEKDLIFIPRIIDGKRSDRECIPCLFLPYSQGSSKLMIYFHGNAEDLGQAYQLLNHLRNTLKIHVLAVEFPGYGIYPGSPSAKSILEDANTVFDYLTDQVGWSNKDIILFGRSLGTGPATELAAFKDPGALLLMSAYTSIRGVVQHISGYFTQYLIAERFKNIELMEHVQCPTFLIHGQLDELIPHSHSEKLHEK
jgi:abhydrolase domain-containing protein 17